MWLNRMVAWLVGVCGGGALYASSPHYSCNRHIWLIGTVSIEKGISPPLREQNTAPTALS